MLLVPEWRIGVRGEVLGREALPQFLPAWSDLCARTIEDNVYYSPAYALALLDSVARQGMVRFAAVWDGRELIALLPFTTPGLPVPLLRPTGRAWQTKYTFSCTPLLDRDRASQGAETLLDVLASVRRGEWILPTVNIDGPACLAVTAALRRRARPWSFLGEFQRASLDADCTYEEHLSRHLRPKRRNDLRRNRRRLEELGTVAHESHDCGPGLADAVEAFLAIEASGWKGQSRTALACDSRTARFARKAFTGEAGHSICRADTLTLDGKPIAVSLTVFAGGTGFTVKCTYDEQYRAFSAGLVLELEVIRSFLSEKWADRLDAATAGAHVVDSLWPGRTAVGDLLFSLAPRMSEPRLTAVRRSEQTRRSARASAKALLSRLGQD